MRERVIGIACLHALIQLRTNSSLSLPLSLPPSPSLSVSLSHTFSLPPFCAHTQKQDSTEITGADRSALAELCYSVSSNLIVITHGTDTMIETAKALAAGRHSQNISSLLNWVHQITTGLFFENIYPDATYHKPAC